MYVLREKEMALMKMRQASSKEAKFVLKIVVKIRLIVVCLVRRLFPHGIYTLFTAALKEFRINERHSAA